MEKADGEKIVIKLTELVDTNKERIFELTSEIMKLQNDLTQENVLKIKQNILGILRCISSVDSVTGFYQLRANRLLTSLNECVDKVKESHPLFNKGKHLVFELDHFCTEVSTWQPIQLDISKKGANITINFPKSLNIASIVNYLRGEK